jgi:hypothetical protein
MRHARWGGVLGAVLLGLLGEAGAVAGQPDPPGGGECVDCSDCLKNGDFGNKAFEGDETSIHDPGGGTHSTCITSGTCEQQHPYLCPGGFAGVIGQQRFLALIDEFTQAVVAADEVAARRIAASADDRIVYVPERRAVQALGCQGQIVAHIPLPVTRHVSDRSAVVPISDTPSTRLE